MLGDRFIFGVFVSVALHGVALDDVLKSGSGGTNGFCADLVSVWVLQGLRKSIMNGLL